MNDTSQATKGPGRPRDEEVRKRILDSAAQSGTVSGKIYGISTLGNVMVQAVATGHLANLHEGRAAIARSVECLRFAPHKSPRWDEAYARFCALQDLKSAAPVS